MGTPVALEATDMLRIFSDGQPPGEVRLRLAGRITGEWVDELRRACDDILRQNGHGSTPLVLDLAEVAFIDARGIALFRELATRHVVLTNGSLFAAELLREVADVDR